MHTSERWLRHVIDPGETLPPVQLRVQSRTYEVETYGAYALSSCVGRISIGRENTYDAFAVRSSYVDEQLQGKGYGLSMYLGAAALAYIAGFELRSDSMVSRDAARVWLRLQNKGLAHIEEPFHWRGMEEYSHKGAARFIELQALNKLHREVGVDFEREGVSGRLAVAGLETAERGNHGTVVGAEFGVSVLDDDFWQSV